MVLGRVDPPPGLLNTRLDADSRLSVRHEISVWWLQLVAGIIEIALGFWAAGDYGRSAVMLVAWVAAIAVTRGIRDIVLAFRIREIEHGTWAAI
jgi:uncharacterized membrane protein HdeD (DUF308 family)